MNVEVNSSIEASQQSDRYLHKMMNSSTQNWQKYFLIGKSAYVVDN